MLAHGLTFWRKGSIILRSGVCLIPLRESMDELSLSNKRVQPEIEAGPDQWLCSVKVWSGATFASFFASV